jgi:hypothetical protein
MRIMAESKRTATHKPVVGDDDSEQKKKDRGFIFVLLGLFAAVIAGMVLLSKFLSGS